MEPRSSCVLYLWVSPPYPHWSIWNYLEGLLRLGGNFEAARVSRWWLWALMSPSPQEHTDLSWSREMEWRVRCQQHCPVAFPTSWVQDPLLRQGNSETLPGEKVDHWFIQRLCGLHNLVFLLYHILYLCYRFLWNIGEFNIWVFLFVLKIKPVLPLAIHALETLIYGSLREPCRTKCT
jgi:hypothetical protein